MANKMKLDGLTGEEVVISGIAGRFPSCSNVDELREKLLAGVDCVTDNITRWESTYKTVPTRMGETKNASKFDYNFFGVSKKLMEVMDPTTRISLECSYEAIVDAGINPINLRGSKTAVYVGYAISEREMQSIHHSKVMKTTLGMLGGSRAMFANRISFFFGFTGPSITMNCACTSSGSALEKCIDFIRSGESDYALAVGSNISLNPHLSAALANIGILASDGVHRSFDSKASGLTRSEAVTAIFLQKAKTTKRIYAEVLGVNVMFQDNNSLGDIFYPTAESQVEVMKETLSQSGIKASDVSYVEADGFAHKDIDKHELQAIDTVYGNKRDSPLFIGSVKSNIGYTFAANTLNSIVKVAISMEEGCIPPNLHYESPSLEAKGIREGRLKVLTEKTPWTGTYAAVNTVSYTGTHCHVLLKKHFIKKKDAKDDILRLVLYSGRTKEAIESCFKSLFLQRTDTELVQMMHDVYETDVLNHLYRGYALLPPKGIPTTRERISQCQNQQQESKELWFVFSGMGSQWPGMGETLMQIPVFAEAIDRCDAVLRPQGYDIKQIICDKDPKIFDNIVHSFIGIAAIQIGLVDVLTTVGIRPDKIIGHSVGELGCAYADGCFTAEQMILSALSRGLASIECELIHGAMAAVGLSYEEIQPLCPPEIDVACHNSSNSATISGPVQVVQDFVAQLQAKGIFAKGVATSNIAYHSRYIAPAGPKLLEYLKKVIPDPKPRSERWISTSVPKEKWNMAHARVSSAEYHTNNLLNPVLFAETISMIPQNAITIEIAPHGLLQAILKKALPKSCVNIAMTRKTYSNNTELVLSAIGKLYLNGFLPKPKNLYPKVDYPVGTGTASISSLIKWNHTEDYTMFLLEPKTQKTKIEYSFDLKALPDYAYLEDFKIAGETVVPCSVYLDLVRRTFHNMSKELNYRKTQEEQEQEQEVPEPSTVFEKIEIYMPLLTIPKESSMQLVIMVQIGSGRFEVSTQTQQLVVTGTIRLSNNVSQEFVQPLSEVNTGAHINKSEAYKNLLLRGYEYKEFYKCIESVSASGSTGRLIWRDTISLLESMIQLYILGSDEKCVQMPLSISKIIIDVKSTEELAMQSKVLPLVVEREINVIRAAGVEIQGLSLVAVNDAIAKSRSVVNEIIQQLQLFPNPISIQTRQNKTTKSGDCEWIPLMEKDTLVSRWQVHGTFNEELPLVWTEAPPLQRKNDQLVKVEYAACNKDDLNSKKLISNNAMPSPIGLEYSGTDSRGNKLMGISTEGSATNVLLPDINFTWDVPDSWSMEDAATVPLPYLVAYAALYLKGNITKGCKVLIHEGESDVGQALISLASKEACDIYVTYETEVGKKIIESMRPAIPKDQIIPSWEFEYRFLARMKTPRLNLAIVNCSTPRNIESFLRCVNEGGNLVLIGNPNDKMFSAIGIMSFLRNLGMFGVIPSKLLSMDLKIKKQLANMIKQGLISGAIKPILARRVITRKTDSKAVKRILSNLQCGKVLIKMQSEQRQCLALPRVYFSSEKCQLLIEGLNTFGMELADWMINRGAKKLVITSQRTIKGLHNCTLSLANLQNRGATIVIRENVNLTDIPQLQTVMNEAAQLGEIEVIFDLQRTIDESHRCANEWTSVTKLIDEESRKAFPSISRFVVFSVLPNFETVLQRFSVRDAEAEAICKRRQQDKLPGLLIVWGPVKEMAECQLTSHVGNLEFLQISQCLRQLDLLLRANAAVVSAYCRKIVNIIEQKNDTKMIDSDSKSEETLKMEFIRYLRENRDESLSKV